MKLNNRPNVKTTYWVSIKKGPSGFLVKFRTSKGLEMFPRWKNIYHENGSKEKKNPEVAILRSYKTDFKTKTIGRDKAGHYIMTKGSIQHEDITILSIYVPNIGAP